MSFPEFTVGRILGILVGSSAVQMFKIMAILRKRRLIKHSLTFARVLTSVADRTTPPRGDMFPAPSGVNASARETLFCAMPNSKCSSDEGRLVLIYPTN